MNYYLYINNCVNNYEDNALPKIDNTFKRRRGLI